MVLLISQSSLLFYSQCINKFRSDCRFHSNIFFRNMYPFVCARMYSKSSLNVGEREKERKCIGKCIVVKLITIFLFRTIKKKFIHSFILHTHTHTHIYIYIFNPLCSLCINGIQFIDKMVIYVLLNFYRGPVCNGQSMVFCMYNTTMSTLSYSRQVLANENDIDVMWTRKVSTV